MPNNIVDSDIWTDPVQSQADGEAVNSTEELISHQDLADRARYLYNRSIEAKGGSYPIPLATTALMDGATWTQRFGWNITMSGLVQFNAGAGSTDRVIVPVPALTGCSFSNIIISLNGGANGMIHTALPVLPTLYLYKLDAAAGTYTLVGSQIDTSPTLGDYEILHTIIYTPVVAQTLNANTQYQLQIEGESGLNAVSHALVIFGAKMTVVPT